MSLTSSAPKLAAGVVLTGAAGFTAGWLEAQAPLLRRFDVPILEPGSQPIRILHLSDFHFRRGQEWLVKFVRSLAGLEPDLVVNTGDNLSSAEGVNELWNALEPYDVPGVYVFGSNDYYTPKFRNPLGYLWKKHSPKKLRKPDLPVGELEEGFQAMGWKSLNNERAIFNLRGQTIEFRGTNDAHIGWDDYSQVAGPANDGVDVSIGVTHSPYSQVLTPMVADGLPLILAGHTHGGQVCLPFKGAIVSNCDLDPTLAKGLNVYETSWLHVSAGLGTSTFAPYRLFCRPEASLLTLVPRDAVG